MGNNATYETNQIPRIATFSLSQSGMRVWSLGHGEREPITWVWGRSPQRGPGAKPLVRGAKPPKAENFLASGCATEAANLPHSAQTLTLSK